MVIIVQILLLVVWVYSLLVIARIILEMVQSFVPDWRPRGAMVVVAEAIYTPTDPPLRALRSVVPAVPIGPVRLDLSPLILLLLCQVITTVLSMFLAA